MSGVAEVSPKYLAEVASNSIPVGYKQTEVGVIPDAWDISSLSSLSMKITDGTHDTPRQVREGRPFLTAIHVKDSHIDFDGCYFVSEIVHQEIYRRCNPEFGDILMVNIGAGTATTAVVDVTYEFSLKNVALIKPNKFNNGTYVNYALSFTREKTLETVVGGGAQPFLSLNQIANLKIAAPHLKEQIAIANALSDVDALISELEKLIVKKQAIKTATMQQLLTGRIRLPQFALREDGTLKGIKPSELGEIPEDWEVQCLGNFIAALEAGVSVNSVDKSDAFPHGKHILKTSCVDRGNFITEEKKSILPSDLARAKCSPTKGTIIVSRMNTPALVGEIGYVACDHPDLFLPDRLWQMRFKADSSVNSRWLSYVLSFPSVSKRIKDAATGTSGSMKNISKGSLMGLEIAFPICDEQTAIASILSDIDAEIQSLQQRLSKTRQIKQGMMQELLTGKTRLLQGIKND